MKIGFFGKLPGYGDFIQRNVGPELVNFWDNWLSQGFDTARHQLKDNWRQVYFTSPIWHFSLAANIASAAPVSGLMMPSVDAAGRDYPFIVFCEHPGQANVFRLSASIEPYHQQAEGFLLSLLESSRPDLDEVMAHLERIYADYTRLANESVNSARCESDHPRELFRYDSVHHEPMANVHQDFAARIHARAHQLVSIWVHCATERLNHHYRYYHGMPPVEIFTSLLEGS